MACDAIPPPSCSQPSRTRFASCNKATQYLAMASKTLEFFYDCSSPWTYLAFHKIEEVAADTGATLVWKPVLVGGVFNAVNDDVYQQRANANGRKLTHYIKDLGDALQTGDRRTESLSGELSESDAGRVRGCRTRQDL